VQLPNLRCIDPTPLGRARDRLSRIFGARQLLQNFLDLLVALDNLLLIELPQLVSLPQRKHVLLFPGPLQRLPQPTGLALLNLWIAQGQQGHRIALSP
jgi:hypothetical protein